MDSSIGPVTIFIICGFCQPAEFDLFITADQNIRYQQNLASRQIPVIELSTNKLRRLLAAVA
jgi:hypothetical protein